MIQEVYSSKLTLKTSADLKEFYRYVYKKLVYDGWEGIYGKDRYEYYYYHRVVGNMWFVNINWKARRNFWKEEPKIDWILDLNFRTVAYDTEKKYGEINFTIKASVDIEDIKEPEVRTRSENILYSIFKLKPSFLRNVKELFRKKIPKIELVAMRELFIYSENFKKDVMDYLKGYYY